MSMREKETNENVHMMSFYEKRLYRKLVIIHSEEWKLQLNIVNCYLNYIKKDLERTT